MIFPSTDDRTVRGDQAATKVNKGTALMVPEATTQNSEVVWLTTITGSCFLGPTNSVVPRKGGDPPRGIPNFVWLCKGQTPLFCLWVDPV